jgi:hypothetical protein
MKQEQLNIKYSIKGIQPYDQITGWVEILLVPMDPLNVPKTRKMPKNIMISGPAGPIPEEAMEQMQGFLEHIMPGMGARSTERDREIVLIEEERLFQDRGWKYGDQISVTFEKLEMKDDLLEESKGPSKRLKD